ncbi:UPF0301 protein [Saliniradius amylolyticus]|uniref:UPF0301 protein HMF8227_02417 n=1 Tax=Saliniradius amylolyticus TaxID=2183582 RepID=A0A2S2E5J2_9ALTE|nr:YqgE/AlgH family protein [Saliniradius amylolyticus]AWL12869.1 UPF0301 protein [Saliniradius amylolyticus]
MQSLENHFLIAMPSMEDSYFARSVTYICEHNEEGAMGIVLNKPVGLKLKEMLKQVDEGIVVNDDKAEQIVVAGGPVAPERGFILHSPQQGWGSSLSLTPEIMVTTSKDILDVLGNEQGPAKSVVALGYAGWSPGQLEQELQDNSWLTIEADPELLFDVPVHQKWETAVKKLGVDIWQLAPGAGHA